MANPFTGSNITGCNSPALGSDKDTYTSKLDALAQVIDGHDHTNSKGVQIPTGGIADAAITPAKLASDSVTTVKILDANVTTAKIADSNVTTAKIADANVTTAKIADSNVTTSKVADVNVTAAKLASDSVETAKIKNGAVTSAKLDTNISVGGALTAGTSVAAGTTVASTTGMTQAGKNVVVSNTNAASNLEIIRGFVGSDGTALEGEGFSSSYDGATYHIIYATPFADSAIVSVTLYRSYYPGDFGTTPVVVSKSTGGFDVQILSVYGVSIGEWSFSFMAIGRRA